MLKKQPAFNKLLITSFIVAVILAVGALCYYFIGYIVFYLSPVFAYFPFALANEKAAVIFLVLLAYIILLSILLCYFAYRYLILQKRFKDFNVAVLPANLLENFYDILRLSNNMIFLWKDAKKDPLIYGAIADFSPHPKADFANNLSAYFSEKSSSELAQALKLLLEQGKAFGLALISKNGKLINSWADVNAGCAFLRLAQASPKEQEAFAKQNELAKQAVQYKLLRQLLDKVDCLAAISQKDNVLLWQNKGLCEAQLPPALAHDLRSGCYGAVEAAFGDQLLINGQPRLFDIYHEGDDNYQIMLAFDKSDKVRAQKRLEFALKNYQESLDLLSSAIAIFDSNYNLRFFNRAFAALWRFEKGFLASHPSHLTILDNLRERGLLPEHRDWSSFKADILAAYQSLETLQYLWSLPDGRTLRLFAHPYLGDGVIWFYENLTEKLELETRFNSLIKAQGETLDHLADGVALFGRDGRLRILNQAFISLWHLPFELAIEGTHINEWQDLWAQLIESQDLEDLIGSITSYQEGRQLLTRRINLKNDKILEYSLVPLPQGQTMLRFTDVTASVGYALALQQKNEVLQLTEKLRLDFIKHVAYELRTPLTSLIGYSDILAQENFGSLNARQQSFVNHMVSASRDLLDIVNDILDLASVDAGIMQLQISKIELAEVIDSVLTRISPLAQKKKITLLRDFADPLPELYADEQRLRQLLVKLFTYIIQNCPLEAVIRWSIYSEEEFIIFSVHNCSSQIPLNSEDFTILSAAEEMGIKSNMALALSLVKGFVELHGGFIKMDQLARQAIGISCYFYQKPAKAPLLHS